jgi:hypothetical protein
MRRFVTWRAVRWEPAPDTFLWLGNAEVGP